MIEVMLAYRKPDNTLIERGIYKPADIAQYVDYLVKAGHAKWIDNEPTEALPEETAPEVEPEQVPLPEAPRTRRRRKSKA